MDTEDRVLGVLLARCRVPPFASVYGTVLHATAHGQHSETDGRAESDIRPQEKRILKCPVEGCGKVFRSSPGYRYHLKSHASDPRPHQCRCCMKKFKSANGLKYHLRKSHSIEPVASKAKALITTQNSETSNCNEDSESAGDDDCVVPSLPSDHLLLKNSPPQQQHESVLRMNHSLSDYKTDHVFKTQPNNEMHFKSEPNNQMHFKSEHDMDYKNNNELSMNNIDSNNNNNNNTNNNNNSNNNNTYTRHNAYDESEGMCYGSQAESTFRYGSYPDHNNVNLRYGVEGNSSSSAGRYSYPAEEMETMRLGGPQPFSPKSSYRDHFRENYRDGLRAAGDYTDRRTSASTSMQDYYQQRSSSSMMPQDRYPGVIGYSRGPETPSRLNYPPRFDYPMRGYGMTKSDYMKSEVFHRNHSGSPYAQEGRSNDFHRLNDSTSSTPFFRNPNDCVNSGRGEHGNFKTNQNESGGENFRRFDKFNSTSLSVLLSPISNGSRASHLREESRGYSSDNAAKAENSEAEDIKPRDLPFTKKLQSKTDINGNSVVESSGILKRRSSKPIPPALIIEPPVVTGDEKKDDASKFLPPEVNRLAEFAEFATSPQSPLVQSPFPLTLTPGLLGAGSTPDWMTKSFTRFFFPDKPPSYLSTSTLNNSRHNQDEEESESRPVTSSLPPSPFIDNVSTPQPFWTTQAWPTPVWHCFIKGCSLKFEHKDDEFRLVEDIAYCNSLLNKRNDEANYGLNGLRVVEIKEIKDVITNSKISKGLLSPVVHEDRVIITFESMISCEPRLFAKCPVDHLFLVKHKGWSSPRPTEAMTRYGIPFQCLQRGDICIPSAQHKEMNSNTLSPLVSCTEAFPFSGSDNSAASALSAMAKRQEMSSERLPPLSLMSTASMSAHSPAAESVSSTTTATFSPGEAFSRDVPYSMVLPTGDQSTTRGEYQSEKPQQEQQQQQQQQQHEKSSPKPTQTTTTTTTTTKKAKRKRKTNNLEEKQRRPMNGFMLFAKKMRIELTQKFPGKDNRAISKVLGEQWRSLSTGERQDFANKAKVMADERRKINPDCWKRKRKKSKGGEAEHEVDKMKIKTENSPGPFSKDSPFSVA
eukprot:gene6266-6986_t